jgi:CheY-like chemotaxis protein
VLIAEDNLMNQRILKSMVEKLGHICHIAVNGKEAVEEFRKQSLDVIFMDCRMPILDGFEATKMIRQEESSLPSKSGNPPYARHVPIIALTADIMHGTREACLQVGMDDYLHKPVKMAPIQEILQALVEKKHNLAQEAQQQIAIVSSTSDEFDSGKKPSVLLVEDNEVNIKIGSMILRKHGFDVHVARDGQSSLEMVKANPNAYQIILMDMHMPGMDGQTATALIRLYEEENNLPRKPIIALTGDTTEGFRGICLAAGCSEYMPKPVDYPLLVQLCKKFVNDYQRIKS